MLDRATRSQRPTHTFTITRSLEDEALMVSDDGAERRIHFRVEVSRGREEVVVIPICIYNRVLGRLERGY